MSEINITDSTGKNPLKIGYIQNQPVNTNYLEPTSFKLVISKIPETSFFCQSVNIPGISISDVRQETMFNPIINPGGQVNHESFSVKFIVSEGVKNWLELYNWIRSASTYQDFDDIVPQSKSLVSDAILYVLSSKNNINLEVQFNGLFPKSLSSIDFEYSDTELQTLICSAEFSFSYYNVRVIS